MTAVIHFSNDVSITYTRRTFQFMVRKQGVYDSYVLYGENWGKEVYTDQVSEEKMV